MVNFIKEKKIVILSGAIILIIVGIFSWIAFQRSNQQEEIFTLSGVVSEINVDGKYFIVKPIGGEKEIKATISNTTKLIKLEVPFDFNNPPAAGTQFTPTQTEIGIGDFKINDSVFIKSSKNIAGKSKISNIELIQILP